MTGTIAGTLLTLALGQAGDVVVPREWLAIGPLDVRGRRPFNASATFARCLLDPEAPPPKEGEKLVGELGREQVWTQVTADADGNVGAGQRGPPWQAAFTTVEWPEAGIALADLDGAGTVWVNGVPQVGDPYGDGMGGLPVPMKKGANAVYVSGTRGPFRLALSKAGAELLLNPFDATVPDLVFGKPPERIWLGLLVVNASEKELRDVVLERVSSGPDDPFEDAKGGGECPSLGPCGIDKIRLALVPRASHPAFAKPGKLAVTIRVRSGALAATTSITIEIKAPSELRRCTYVSHVDDSVQSYAVLPPVGGKANALVLTLHGAGVDCMGQAASYSPKPDFWIVAPTNRRRFGFDWQDWGRRDAYDVLGEMITGGFGIDWSRIYLTGHSMGGHGTWHLAANDPDTFAAIAPSAGWSSLDSYGGGRPKSALSDLWHAADGAGRTLDLIDNLKQIPTFVLHGTKDDNVPLSEAQLMLDALTKAGAAPQHHFQEGAGHWWDGDAAPGADCVDWPGIFELFRSTRQPEESKSFSFTTGTGTSEIFLHEIQILQPIEYGKPARVEVRTGEDSEGPRLETVNVRKLALRLDGDGLKVPWTIDGQSCELPRLFSMARSLREQRGPHPIREQRLLRIGSTWAEDASRDREKSPTCSGPFKRAFDHGFLLVPGTTGSPAETRELAERARYDAALWWYRGNGHAPIVTDVELLAHPDEFCNSNVILFGNRDTNAAWPELLDEHCPIEVRRGSIECGGQEWTGDSLAAVFVRPRRIVSDPGSTVPPQLGGGGGLVAAFADTGVRGSRLGYVLLPFLSGVGYPDYAVYSAEILAKGDGGVLAAGWFAHDWSLPSAK
jgi:dienelactone hydrolase